jgi:hypothetical protein
MKPPPAAAEQAIVHENIPGGLFPEIEAMFGDPLTDIFFGLLGAFFAAIAYETVAMFLRPD